MASRLDILAKCGVLDPSDDVKRKNGLLSLYGEANDFYKLSEELVHLLIANGADVNATNRHGVTPLFLACGNSSKKVVRVLLDNGADVNAVSDFGTAIHCACTTNSTDNVSLLLDYGADINITYGGNIAPFDCGALGSLVGAGNYSHCPERRELINENVCDILLRRVIMMQAANLYVNEANLDYLGPKGYYNVNNPEIQGDDDLCTFLTEFPRDCEKEISVMKCEKIGTSDFSYYDILKAGNEKLVSFSGNKLIVERFNLGHYKQQFPIYSGMMKSNFRYGQKRRDLTEKTNELFRLTFVILPHLCIEKIISYLTNSDLFKLSDYGLSSNDISSFPKP